MVNLGTTEWTKKFVHAFQHKGVMAHMLMGSHNVEELPKDGSYRVVQTTEWCWYIRLGAKPKRRVKMLRDRLGAGGNLLEHQHLRNCYECGKEAYGHGTAMGKLET